MKSIAVLVLFFASCASGFAARLDLPNRKLPDSIKPVPGKVTLHADYNTRGSNGTISVYLINASKTNIDLASQDRDVFLKLEVENANGNWVRSQPHAYSWCGNSYFELPSVRPGHFLRIDGYQPTNGQPQRIRFSFHQQKFALSSNVGSGLASARDIDLASRDDMAVYEGSFDFVSSLALGKVTLTNGMPHVSDLQQVAIRELASPRFDSRQSRKVLSEVIEKFPEQKRDVEFELRELDLIEKSKGTARK